MLRVGIIGCGKITEVRHAPEYSENPRCEIGGFYDFVPERAQAFAEKYGGRAFESVEALIESVDAVSVCSANRAHAQNTICALEAGRHVLCEKPMATSLAECEAMVAAAKKANRLLMIGHNQRFNRAHQEARRLIQDGTIGRVLSFHTAFGHSGPENWTGTPNPWFFDKKRAAMGALADLGIHKTDLIHFLLGEPIVRVSARMTTLDKHFPDGSPITVEDNALCIYETRSGAVGQMHVSWTFYGREDNSTRIYGTTGEIRLYDDPDYSLILECRGREPMRLNPDRIQTNDDQNAGKRVSTGVIDAFVDAITLNKPTPATGEEALKAMRVIFAAEESAKTGKTISINQDE